jgi:multiple sugar transport system permease protein
MAVKGGSVVKKEGALSVGAEMVGEAARSAVLRRGRVKLAKKIARHTIAHIALAVTSISFIMPFIWMLSTSLKTDPQIFKFPPIWIPNPVDWKNYPDALNFIPFWTFMKNTVVYSIVSAFGAVLSCSLVAYSFSRIQWPGRDALFAIVLSTMMLPFYVTMIPLFIVFKTINWTNSFKPLIVPAYLGNAFFIFLLRQFFMTIPQELSDSARIDGCSELGIYSRIILPLSKPALATVALFQFLNAYRDFIGPLIYLNDESKYTLSLGIQLFQRFHSTEWALLMAASVVMTLPIIFLFFFTQRTFIQGITMTGLKG